MTARGASSTSSARSLLTTRLVAAVSDRRRSAPERHHAADLLSLFASEPDATHLEALVLAEIDPWVRTLLLRAIVRQRLVVRDRALARLCAATLDGRHREDFTSVLLAARSPEQDRIAHAAVREANGGVLRDVVLADSGHTPTFSSTARLARSTRDLAYQRCCELGLLDDTLAWATLDQPASQRRVLDRDPLDLRELANATRNLSRAELDAMFAGHPAALQRSLASFAVRASSDRPTPRDRDLLTWLAHQSAPRLHHAGLRGLLLLDRARIEPTLVDRLANSEEPLVRLLALEARVATGDDTALAALLDAATHAPHVVLRAQALRSVREQAGSVEVVRSALRGDHATFDAFYTPAVSEAAIGLARGAAIPELDALTDLVDAHRAVANDDAPHAIKASIRSWLSGTSAMIRPVWYELYMSRRG
jgi:hypothetical protein